MNPLQQLNTISRDGGRIAFVQACWHEDIVNQGRQGFLEEMVKSGFPARQVDCYRVPGALEIPLKCRVLARSGRYQLLVAAGLVVDGGIYRHEFVAQAVISGLMQVQLEAEVPVLSLVLTPKDFHDSADHRDFFFRHFRGKGIEVAQGALAMLSDNAARG